MQTHTWMIILGLLGHHWNFSAVTSLRGREGARWALEGAKKKKMRESLNFNRMLPRENSHHLCVSSMPQSHSFFLWAQGPWLLWYSLGGKSSSATARFYRCFFGGGEKSFDESGENVVSYPATALDNDIPPAVANSSRAEDVPEDKCHYQLSVIWSGFQLHHPDGGVCWKGKFPAMWAPFFYSFCSLVCQLW